MSSASQPPIEIREALKTFVQDDLQHAKGDTRPLFGHIAMPPCRIPGILPVIHELLRGDRTKETAFIFVNFDEVLYAPKDEHPIKNLLTTEFLNDLRNNIRSETRPQQGPLAWREPIGSLESLDDERTLPLDGVIVMQLNPQISAECALALTCVVDWACANFSVPRDIRVVTMSPPVGQDILFDLVSQKESNPLVSLCDLETLWAQDPTKDCHIHGARSSKQIAEALYDAIKEPNANSRLVLSFDRNVEKYLFNLISFKETNSFEHIPITASDNPSDIKELTEKAKRGRTIVATVFGQFEHPTVTIDAFQELHLVLGRIDTATPTWDNKSQQVLVYPHWTSKQDRTSQLWWAYQPGGAAVTVYSAKYTPGDFIENGASHVRLVQGSELGGYVAAALDLISFGVGSEDTMALFIQNPLVVEDIKNRLITQRLISDSGLNLNPTEAKFFRYILPEVNYDHRLAMLLALDSSPPVRYRKAEFAATLLAGLCCSFKNKMITLQDIQDVFVMSRAYGGSLVKYGTTQATIGLVKHYYLSVMVDSNDSVRLRDIVKIQPGARVQFLILQQFLNAFRQHRLDTSISSHVMKWNDISEADKLQFHIHLFRAYMHQTILLHRPTEGNHDTHEHDFTSLTSMQACGFSRGDEVLSLLFNPWRVSREVGNEGWYGISHELSRSSTSLTFHDWDVIPAEVVALWSRETGLTPGDLASTVVYPNSNSIEVTDEASDIH